MRDLDYLRLLSHEYPTIREAAGAIINLKAISGLPKGTEYFFSDLHGEYEAFLHLLHSSSGIIREKIRETFGHIMGEEEGLRLANLIYEPEKNIQKLKNEGEYTEDWQKITMFRLVQIAKVVSSKFTRDKVRKKLPADFDHIIDELIHVDYSDENKKLYFDGLIHTIIEIGVAELFIVELCRLIRNLTIDNLHIIGDIFDRGPRADVIMEELLNFHDVDIQWGNHDIDWMGAFCGNAACICNVVRVAISYNNFDVLEDGYGINLRPLSMFAANVYRNDPCARFMPHILDENLYDAVDPGLAAKMHKAIAILGFKAEGQILKRHPEWNMEDRILLEHINFEKRTLEIDGQKFPIQINLFPTVDPADPLKYTPEEEALLYTLKLSFRHSALLARHINFLYTNGGMYKCCNNNLLFHGCIPMSEDGSFQGLYFKDSFYSGKSLMDKMEEVAEDAYYLPEDAPGKQDAVDFMWYLWCGARSPLFGKGKIATFERYFIDAEEMYKEKMNAYYTLNEREDICDKILEEFGLPTDSGHIINGHVPVKTKDGEMPVKANGKLFVIDGGLSKAYQSRTGIAGYTLIFNSRHLALAEHKPYDPQKDSTPRVMIVEKMKKRVMVADTDQGRELAERIEDLKELLQAYRKGALSENRRK